MTPQGQTEEAACQGLDREERAGDNPLTVYKWDYTKFADWVEKAFQEAWG